MKQADKMRDGKTIFSPLSAARELGGRVYRNGNMGPRHVPISVVTAAGEWRPGVSRYEAAKSGGEALQRSTRSPLGGAWRRSAGTRPDSLRSLEDGLGKRLRPYFFKSFYDDHVKRYKKRPIYWLITSPKGMLQPLFFLRRYDRDTVKRFLNDYLRPCRQRLEAKRVSAVIKEK